MGFLTIYDVEPQGRLFDAVQDELSEDRREALERLVQARGPVRPEILIRIKSTVDSGKGFGYIAQQLTETGEVAGMGKGWTAKRVRGVYLDYLEHLSEFARRPWK